MLAKNLRAPRGARFAALSLTTIASMLAPTKPSTTRLHLAFGLPRIRLVFVTQPAFEPWLWRCRCSISTGGADGQGQTFFSC